MKLVCTNKVPESRSNAKRALMTGQMGTLPKVRENIPEQKPCESYGWDTISSELISCCLNRSLSILKAPLCSRRNLVQNNAMTFSGKLHKTTCQRKIAFNRNGVPYKTDYHTFFNAF